MYNLPHFKAEDNREIIDFLNDHPFAFLTGSNSSGQLAVTQIPVMVEERDGKLFLQGHIVRKTDHHKAFLANPHVLAVFTGPNCYVSASWYSDPKMGSTWNYMSVHLKGKIQFLGEEGLISMLKKLSLRFENNDQGSPTIYDNLPDEYVKHMIPAIVGFEIEVTEMNNVFKLSQNRDRKSYDNIIAQLEKKGGDSALIAKEMEKRKEKLFI